MMLSGHFFHVCADLCPQPDVKLKDIPYPLSAIGCHCLIDEVRTQRLENMNS